MFSGFQCEEAAPQYLPLHRRQGPQGVCGEFTLETTIFLPDGVNAAFIVCLFFILVYYNSNIGQLKQAPVQPPSTGSLIYLQPNIRTKTYLY